MFLIKFFYFLKGYVIIDICGKSVWKLVSECADKGIKMYNIISGKAVSFTIMQQDFYELYNVAQSLDVKIEIKKECGLSNLLYRYRKRVGFPVGIVLFVLFFTISTRFLWDVRVETDGNIDEVQVKQLLSDIGVRTGALLKNLPDGVTMKNHLVNSMENVPWAWVYVKGVRAIVSVHEGTVPPVMVDEDEPCDIIASRDGFVTEMSVKEGMKVALPGNAVNAGEVLISGLVEVGADDNKNTYTVHADGEVMALTRYKKTQEYNLWEDRPEFTGNEKMVYELNFSSGSFTLFDVPDYSYSVSTEREIFTLWGFSLKQIKCMEAEKNKIQLPKEWVVEFAKRDLTAQISSQLGNSARLQSEEYTVEEKKNSVVVTAEMEFIEDIGITVPR